MSCVGLLLSACETRQPVATAPALPEKAPEAKPLTAAAPPLARLLPARNAYQVWYGPTDTSSTPPTVTIDGQQWRVRTLAEPDSAHRLTFTNPAQPGSPEPPSVERGAEAWYSFQVLDSAGRPRFTTRLRKADFTKEVDGSLLTVSGAAPARYLGYWAARHALAFEMSFVRDETDDGIYVLVLLDAATGRLLHQVAERTFMGACDCWPTLTADGKALLTGPELLRADGRIISLERPAQAVAGTRVLNDSTFLVAYESGEYDGPLAANNTRLLNARGQTLRRFTFHGTDTSQGSGGFSLEHSFLAATQTHYLFDGLARSFIIIPLRNPLQLQQLPVARMTPFKTPRRATEMELPFSPDYGPSATLYVDTLTQKMRYHLQEPIH